MKKVSIYLDTSIYNFAIAKDVPKETEITKKLLDEIKEGRYEAFTSEIVLKEIDDAPSDIAIRLRDVLKPLNLEEINIDEDVKALAEKYIELGIIPRKYLDDALHVAVASVNNIDVIISWNFDHLVKVKTRREIVGINALSGYKAIEICSPWEVVKDVYRTEADERNT